MRKQVDDLRHEALSVLGIAANEMKRGVRQEMQGISYGVSWECSQALEELERLDAWISLILAERRKLESTASFQDVTEIVL